MLNTCEPFPFYFILFYLFFFPLKKVSLTNISKYMFKNKYVFMFFEKELEKAERAANTVHIKHTEVNWL